MLISHGLNKKHVSQFFWEVLVGIYRRRTITCLRVKKLYRGFYPVHSARCPLWNDLLCTEVLGNHLWWFSSECWVPHQLKHCSSILQPSKSTILPLSVVTHSIFIEVFSGSIQCQSTKWNNSLALYTLVSLVSWFCLSSTSTSLLLEVVEVLPVFPM